MQARSLFLRRFGGMVNVLVNALGRVLGNEGFFIVVFERLPRGGWHLPSIWFGFALIAAAYALRRAVGQEDKEAEAWRMRP